MTSPQNRTRRPPAVRLAHTRVQSRQGRHRSRIYTLRPTARTGRPRCGPTAKFASDITMPSPLLLLTAALLACGLAAPVSPPAPCPPTYTLKCTASCFFTGGPGTPDYTCQKATYAGGESRPANCPHSFTPDLLQCRRQVDCGAEGGSQTSPDGTSFISPADGNAPCYEFANASCDQGMAPFLMQCFDCPDGFVYAGASAGHSPCVMYENLPPCGGGVLKDGVCA